MTLNHSTLTAGDVATYVKRQFGDEAGVQITDTDIFRWINSALTEIVSVAAPIKGVATAPAVLGQRDYDLSGISIHQIESIHYNDNRLENLPFSEAERLIVSDNQNMSSGEPVFWYEWGGVVSIWPKPQTVPSTIKVYYSKAPTRVTSLSDSLGLADKYYEAIVAWVMSKAYELDEEFDQAANQRNYFTNKITEQNGEELDSATMTYPVITIIED